MNDVREISLTKGYVTIVDEADYEALAAFKWHVNDGYAVRKITDNGKRRYLHMHREIVGALPGFTVDHVNHNTLDNRRSNLRVCTYSENQINKRKKRYPASSKYRGVSRRRVGSKWIAQIRVGGKPEILGYFVSEAEAARAYDLAAIQHYGAFAFPNFPTEAAYLAALAQEVANA